MQRSGSGHSRRLTTWARTLTWRRGLALALGLVLLAWALAPAVRAVTLVGNWPYRAAPTAPADLPVREVSFRASDGTRLAGWLAVRSPDAPSVILVHGFKSTRVSMLPWARFLFAAGYNVLLYDSRGCGQSDGWHIGLGAREPDDVLGAVRYLRGVPDLRDHRFAALGVSLGAGVVVLAGAREPSLLAVVADSSWADERPQLDRMSGLPAGPLTIPALPYEPALVNTLIGADLSAARPVAEVGRIAPRAVLFIHAADDANSTTPLSGERALYAAAHEPKAEWVTPSGGHAGALAAHPAEYAARTLAFLRSALGPVTG
ncbi:MAG TPA: alpha/beta fold hydrolase [Ktedonobacterales bacterium]